MHNELEASGKPENMASAKVENIRNIWHMKVVKWANANDINLAGSRARTRASNGVK